MEQECSYHRPSLHRHIFKNTSLLQTEAWGRENLWINEYAVFCYQVTPSKAYPVCPLPNVSNGHPYLPWLRHFCNSSCKMIPSTLWWRNFPRNMHKLCSPPSVRQVTHEKHTHVMCYFWCIQKFYLCVQWQVIFAKIVLYITNSRHQGCKPLLTC
jgi:hypothetical protein